MPQEKSGNTLGKTLKTRLPAQITNIPNIKYQKHIGLHTVKTQGSITGSYTFGENNLTVVAGKYFLFQFQLCVPVSGCNRLK